MKSLALLHFDERSRIVVRLFSKCTVTPSGCWEWTGFRNDSGYGITRVLGREGWLERTHRLSYFLLRGLDPGELLVCHHCDNPPCFNPFHLFAGTIADNNADAMAKGRAVLPLGRRGPNVSGAKLNAERVREIHEAASNGARRVELAERYGVSDTAISHILCGKTWRHVTGGAVVPPIRGPR